MRNISHKSVQCEIKPPPPPPQKKTTHTDTHHYAHYLLCHPIMGSNLIRVFIQMLGLQLQQLRLYSVCNLLLNYILDGSDQL